MFTCPLRGILSEDYSIGEDSLLQFLIPSYYGTFTEGGQSWAVVRARPEVSMEERARQTDGGKQRARTGDKDFASQKGRGKRRLEARPMLRNPANAGCWARSRQDSSKTKAWPLDSGVSRAPTKGDTEPQEQPVRVPTHQALTRLRDQCLSGQVNQAHSSKGACRTHSSCRGWRWSGNHPLIQIQTSHIDPVPWKIKRGINQCWENSALCHLLFWYYPFG